MPSRATPTATAATPASAKQAAVARLARPWLLALTAVALVIQFGWFVVEGRIEVAAVPLAAVALVLVTRARQQWLNAVLRILLALLLAASVADRFGLLGAPGAAGVSWGAWDPFVRYTAELLPQAVSSGPVVVVVAVLATVAETVLAVLLVFGLMPARAAAATSVLLAGFALAMLTSVGFHEMSRYAVPALCAGAGLLATADSRLRGARLPGSAGRW